MGISGKDGGLLKCEKKLSKGQDIGFVGEITEVNPKIIYDLLEKDFLPIICPIGFDDSCLSYNINADDAACAVGISGKDGGQGGKSRKTGISDRCRGTLPGF